MSGEKHIELDDKTPGCHAIHARNRYPTIQCIR